MKIYLSNFRVILLGLLFSNNLLFSQSKYEFSFGFGMPDYINVKFKYGNRFQFGAGLGTFPLGRGQGYMTSVLHDEYTGNITTLQFDTYYHFVRSKDVNLYKWYWNNGVAFSIVTFEEKTRFYYSRIGKSFNLKNRTGINLDLGIMMFQSLYKEPLNHRLGPLVGTQNRDDFSGGPIASISYFIKF